MTNTINKSTIKIMNKKSNDVDIQIIDFSTIKKKKKVKLMTNKINETTNEMTNEITNEITNETINETINDKLILNEHIEFTWEMLYNRAKNKLPGGNDSENAITRERLTISIPEVKIIKKKTNDVE